MTGPITLQKMGSFFFAGDVARTADGDTVHGDHGYAQFFVPQQSRNLPLILWHGRGQSGKTWESTPDGRDGFWQIFTRDGWPVYIIDQPRRGRAARSLVSDPELAENWDDSEAETFIRFRLGDWRPPAEPVFAPGVQFDAGARTMEQFLRQQVPNTGPEPFPDAGHREFLGGAVAQLVGQVGPSILVTHSHSGQHGWVASMRSSGLVRAVIGLETGEYTFPDDGVPEDVPTDLELLATYMAPQLVSADEFSKLTKIPILLIFGDNIADEPHSDFNIELWRVVRERAKQFAATVNDRGGDCTYLELPDIGILGNTHFPMADLNNAEVATIMANFLAERGLDARDAPHTGPRG